MGGKFVHADDQHEETPVDFGQPEVGAPEPDAAVPDEDTGALTPEGARR
jgi:hypothetical protein